MHFFEENIGFPQGSISILRMPIAASHSQKGLVKRKMEAPEKKKKKKKKLKTQEHTGVSCI